MARCIINPNISFKNNYSAGKTEGGGQEKCVCVGVEERESYWLASIQTQSK